MSYRYEATSLGGLVQILASNYLPHGYWFYVTGKVPGGKSPEHIDQKILKKYDVDLSRQQRARRKKGGAANLHYVRFGSFFIILSTHGKHLFFESEGSSIRDIRRVPLRVHGYSISVKRGGMLRSKGEGESKGEPVADSRYRVHVRISNDSYNLLHADLLNLATHRTADKLKSYFWNQPFEPYAPIRRQLLQLLKAVNSKRLAMGYEKLDYNCIRYRRQIVRPFEHSS